MGRFDPFAGEGDFAAELRLTGSRLDGEKPHAALKRFGIRIEINPLAASGDMPASPAG